MKIITRLIITWFVALALIQSYHAGVNAELKIERAKLRIAHKQGWSACVEQF